MHLTTALLIVLVTNGHEVERVELERYDHSVLVKRPKLQPIPDHLAQYDHLHSVLVKKPKRDDGLHSVMFVSRDQSALIPKMLQVEKQETEPVIYPASINPPPLDDIMDFFLDRKDPCMPLPSCFPPHLPELFDPCPDEPPCDCEPPCPDECPCPCHDPKIAIPRSDRDVGFLVGVDPIIFYKPVSSYQNTNLFPTNVVTHDYPLLFGGRGGYGGYGGSGSGGRRPIIQPPVLPPTQPEVPEPSSVIIWLVIGGLGYFMWRKK